MLAQLDHTDQLLVKRGRGVHSLPGVLCKAQWRLLVCLVHIVHVILYHSVDLLRIVLAVLGRQQQPRQKDGVLHLHALHLLVRLVQLLDLLEQLQRHIV